MRLYYLNKISLILDSLKINHAIFDGALLGFIREKNLIKWDWDAEISISYDDFKCYRMQIIEQIEKEQIGKVTLNNSYSNSKINVILNNNYKYTIQAFHYTKDNKYIYRKMYKYPAKFLNKIEIIKINKYYFPIPQNAEELLCLEYGENWRVPMNSKNKNKYLSKDVYTKKNNIINITYIKIKQKLYFYYRSLFDKLKSFLRKYPVLEYKLGKGRERLFILQLYKIAKKFKEVTLIEIGSSDLNESIILTNILSKTKINSTVYEASEETYNRLNEKKLRNKLTNIKIIHKAITPNNENYFLRESKEKNLNRLVKINMDNTSRMENSTILSFDQIKEINNPEIHKIVKMDIEGLEEDILIDNINLISNTQNITLCIELHQQTYQNPERLKEIFIHLIENKFIIKFVEFSMFCNKEILFKFLNNQNLISKNNNRYLIKNPKNEIIDHLVYCDYRVIDQAPYYSPKNIRSITLHKNQ